MVTEESVVEDASGPVRAAASVQLGENEAAVIDTFVVPTYLRLFWDQLQELLLVGEASRVVHLRCMTGFPDGELLSMMPNTTGVGVDASLPCLSVAGAKMDAFGFEYLHATPEATPLPSDNFSHAVLICPPGDVQGRRGLLSEMARLIYSGGQALVALPGGGSFSEIIDLLAEYALKYDRSELSLSLEALGTAEDMERVLEAELLSAGLKDVTWRSEMTTLTFDSGRALMEDPACRFFIVPQISEWLENDDLGAAMEYVARAVDKYWSDDRFELTLKVLAVSARA